MTGLPKQITTVEITFQGEFASTCLILIFPLPGKIFWSVEGLSLVDWAGKRFQSSGTKPRYNIPNALYYC